MGKISPLAPKAGFPELNSIDGVRFSSACAGVKYKNRLDVMLAEICDNSSIAGVFTKSATRSAAVIDCQKKLLSVKSSSGPFAIVVNSGNSNAFTGKQGHNAVSEICSKFAQELDIPEKNVFSASTGVIGEHLEWKKIGAVSKELVVGLSPRGLDKAAKAIMTTDTFAKGSSEEFAIDNKTIKISGIAKGSGMIAPDMATMLVYIFTDVGISPSQLQKIVSDLNEKTFNSITVDGDTSTSDSLMVVATGKSGCVINDQNPKQLQQFKQALLRIMRDLAHQVVKDGEGASKFIEVNVSGAPSFSSARKVAKSIANSPLVKTAIAGEDPNWGRIIMAIGKSGAKVDRDLLRVSFGNLLVAENGWVSPSYSEEKAAKYMQNDEILIQVDLGLGSFKSVFWTCDFTQEYISINADYRS
ncbi:MAG: bifunctional glutamate N-acetyltransferase/amino-acid acetyltransferase ArgJ [Paracoccaceae bacterium]|nr:MAG: bifunctional glutamate N-acetyltransferase/amino-acid acetyltransferase ArgJ [Paracoccaceae bacterium]